MVYPQNREYAETLAESYGLSLEEESAPRSSDSPAPVQPLLAPPPAPAAMPASAPPASMEPHHEEPTQLPPIAPHRETSPRPTPPPTQDMGLRADSTHVGQEVRPSTGGPMGDVQGGPGDGPLEACSGPSAGPLAAPSASASGELHGPSTVRFSWPLPAVFHPPPLFSGTLFRLGGAAPGETHGDKEEGQGREKGGDDMDQTK